MGARGPGKGWRFNEARAASLFFVPKTDCAQSHLHFGRLRTTHFCCVYQYLPYGWGHAVTALASRAPRLDLLQLLPISPIRSYRKGAPIFAAEEPHGLYVVSAGRVMVAMNSATGHRTVIDVVGVEELFGLEALAGTPRWREHAVALEASTVMTWSVDKIRAIIERTPEAGIAFLQEFAAASNRMAQRFMEMAIGNVKYRLARFLIDRLGRTGCLSTGVMPPLTHFVIADFIGTTRENTTLAMSALRLAGLIHCDRQRIRILDLARLQQIGETNRDGGSES